MSRRRVPHDINSITVAHLQETAKKSKVVERLKKKLSHKEFRLSVMSPNMAFRVATRNGKVSQGASRGDHANVKHSVHPGSAGAEHHCTSGALCCSSAWHYSTRVLKTRHPFISFSASHSSSHLTMSVWSGGRWSTSTRRSVSFSWLMMKHTACRTCVVCTSPTTE